MKKSLVYLLIFLCSCSTAEKSTKKINAEQKSIPENTPTRDDSEELPAPDIDLSTIEEENNQEEAPIVEYPDKSPEFPGGAEELKTWINENLKYPSKAIESKTEGKVYIQFTVLKDGSIDDISIMRGAAEELNKEAIRLVQSMPKWNPGQSKGENVNTRARIPINFSID